MKRWSGKPLSVNWPGAVRCIMYTTGSTRLHEVAARIAELVPDAECGICTRSDAVSGNWKKLCMNLSNGEIDVLVSTTIIETGLDISNVNTMIIHDADRLGLSQLVSAARTGRTFQPDCLCVFDVSKR